ncbi:uncharacterized protein LOC109726028 [Ananas comosus]|uniref:Uncharacterized protein LOC109726028 n=1 Tax=Ananas comosus TaxID=4615 RepID=A0A6P5GZH5_ANACO|nr:uncharacterized protein LOC109726028 [Ananas comosus]
MARDLERSVLFRALSMRRTWVALFLVAYALVLSCSWRLLLSIRAWYAGAGEGAGAWRALYAAVMCGGVFGAAAMAAAAAAALPAAAVAWITVLVLLAFAGRPRRALGTTPTAHQATCRPRTSSSSSARQRRRRPLAAALLALSSAAPAGAAPRPTMMPL